MNPAPDKGQKSQALYALLWMDDLTLSARRLASWLVWHANGYTGRCDPGQSRLRYETGLSVRTVKSALKELVDKGLVSKRLRGTRSTAYTIKWSRLEETFSSYEATASAFQTGGCEPLHLGGAKDCTSEVRETAPKHIEVNTLNKTMFRVGVIYENDGVPFEEMDRHNAQYLLGIEDDNAFLSIFQREMKKGLRFGSYHGDIVAERVEKINNDYDHRYETPLGRSCRLLHLDFYREDDAA